MLKPIHHPLLCHTDQDLSSSCQMYYSYGWNWVRVHSFDLVNQTATLFHTKGDKVQPMSWTFSATLCMFVHEYHSWWLPKLLWWNSLIFCYQHHYRKCVEWCFNMCSILCSSAKQHCVLDMVSASILGASTQRCFGSKPKVSQTDWWGIIVHHLQKTPFTFEFSDYIKS